jgi:hypothetical protein
MFQTIFENDKINSETLVTKVSEQIKRHFYLEILKIQIESVPIFQC